MPLSNLSLSPGATFNNLLARNCEGVERERERARFHVQERTRGGAGARYSHGRKLNRTYLNTNEKA